MPGAKIVHILLFAWLFALIIPPAVTLLVDSGKAVVNVTLNEEEHQDHGKKKVDTKHLLQDSGAYNGFLFGSTGVISGDFYHACHSDNFTDIVLPPPERSA